MRAIVSFLLGSAGFWIARHFKLESPSSLAIAVVIAGSTFVSSILDTTKKGLDIWKTGLEVSKLRAGEAERKAAETRMVQPATSEEVAKYGISIQERKLELLIRLEQQKDEAKTKVFIADSSEKKL